MRRVILPILVLCVGTAAPALADSITITSGTTVATLTNGTFSLNGPGLVASGGLPDGWSQTVALECSPCSAAPPVTLSFSSSCVSCLSEGSTGNVLGGVAYSFPVTFLASFEFSGPTFSSSAVSADHLTFTAPFTMTGNLQAFRSAEGPDPAFFSTDVNGRGTATIDFSTPVGGLFEARSITYDFSSAAPTPEPASLLLLGTGLAAAWQSRRLRRAR